MMRTLPFPTTAAVAVIVPYMLLVPPILAVRTWLAASSADVEATSAYSAPPGAHDGGADAWNRRRDQDPRWAAS